MKLFTQEISINSKSFNRNLNFMVQQLTFTRAGTLNILHSAARKSVFYTKSQLAGCICKMSHLPAHLIGTYTRNTTLPHLRTIKPACQGNTMLSYITRKAIWQIYLIEDRALSTVTLAHKNSVYVSGSVSSRPVGKYWAILAHWRTCKVVSNSTSCTCNASRNVLPTLSTIPK